MLLERWARLGRWQAVRVQGEHGAQGFEVDVGDGEERGASGRIGIGMTRNTSGGADGRRVKENGDKSTWGQVAPPRKRRCRAPWLAGFAVTPSGSRGVPQSRESPRPTIKVSVTMQLKVRS